jgi:cation:H+ antiporter
LDRWEGVVFLGYYVAYTTYLILANQRHDSLENFSTAMIWFVIPLTVLTLGVATARELRRN